MIHDTFRPRFLGQVRLGTPPTMPGVDPVQYVDPFGSTSFQTANRDVLPPAAGCVLVGYKFDNANAIKEVEAQKAQARNYGYTDIRETELPPCDVAAPGFENPWAQVLDPSCNVGNDNQHKAIWACPGPDHERIVQDNKARATEGCEFLFMSEGYWDSSDKQDRINAAISAGRRVIRVYTGKILNYETKSEQREAEVWSCPRFNAVTAPPVSNVNEPVASLPLAPEAKPDLVPVAAGAGVVAILAAIIGGAFGGK